ncbi:hypothetical protein ABV409_05735 [Flagellimonas sp. DF-77]|uniref:hypothetical protein n=1 Tax=Flagellimonas algarum TaxID=3230298 RepID=UPI0033975019
MQWTIRILLLLGPLLFTGIVYAQKKPSLTPPSLKDRVKTTVTLTPDPQELGVMSYYTEDSVLRDSANYLIKGTTTVQNVMVTVIAKDPSVPLTVDFVKKDWKDHQRSGVTEDGIFQTSFDTAGDFGIILSGKDRPAFYLAVWASGEVIPKAETLFYSKTDVPESVPSDTTDSYGSLYLIIAAMAALIIILLFLVLRKKRKLRNMVIPLLALLLTHSLPAQGRGGVMRIMNKINDIIKNKSTGDAISDLSDYGELVSKIRSGAINMGNFLAVGDENSSVELDPLGQPPMPSSCLDSYTEREGESTIESPSIDRRSPSEDRTNEASSGTRTDANTKYGTPEAEDTKYGDPRVSDMDPKDTPFRMPLYDKEGNLIDKGDADDPPEKISTDLEGGIPNPFIGFSSRSGAFERLPKYDLNGGLLDRGDFPDAPLLINPQTGMPFMSPIIDGSERRSSFIRQPKYDADGRLLDPGDFSNAPKEIDPDGQLDTNGVFTGDSRTITQEREPKYDSKGNLVDAGDDPNPPKQIEASNTTPTAVITDEGRKMTQPSDRPTPTNRPNHDRPQNRETPSDGIGKNDAKDGCECLRKAYRNLDHARFTLEKLRIIYANYKKKVDFGIKFGDDVSSIHGVSGLVWQNEKIKILKGVKNLERTYDQKHPELIASLKAALLEISTCEAMLGEKDWYQKFGYFYLTFMNDKYKRKG